MNLNIRIGSKLKTIRREDTPKHPPYIPGLKYAMFAYHRYWCYCFHCHRW